MFFLKDPFNDYVTGPISEQKLREVAFAGKIDGSWEISKSKDGPWQRVASVRGLQVRSSATATTSVSSEEEEEPNSRRVSAATSTFATGGAGNETPSVSPPVSDGATAALKTLQSQLDAARRAHFSSASSIFDIFDWRFRKYLTPWILRITWAIVLVVASLLILLLLVQVVGIWLPDFQWSEIAASGVGDRTRHMETRTPSETWLPFWLRIRIVRTVWQITQIAATAISILWIRVLLELAIVLFNIATTLSSIDVGIKEQSKKD